MAIRTVPIGAPAKPAFQAGVSPEALARRRELAEELLRQSQDVGVVQSIPEGLAKLGAVFFRKQAVERAREKEEEAEAEKRRRLAETFTGALDALEGTSGQDAAGAGVAPVAGGVRNIPAQPGSMADLARVLMGNPDTAELGLEAYLKTRPKPRESKLLTPEEEEQQLRLAQGKQRPRLLTPEEEQQQIRLRRAGKAETNITIGGEPTKGQQEVDKKFAAEFTDFVLSGGFADVDKGLSQLDEVVTALESGENLTGPIVGNLPDTVRAVTNPKSLDMQQQLEEVVQRNLRLILGAQFTEREGTRLIARAYNPALDEKTNAKRVRRLMESIRKARDAKFSAAQYFQEHGTLIGYKGTELATADEIARDADLPDLDMGFKDMSDEELLSIDPDGVDPDEYEKELRRRGLL